MCHIVAGRPIAEDLERYVEDLQTTGARIRVVFAGHSLGGALAVLNTVVLANPKYEDVVDSIWTYTAACPLVLNKVARDHLDDLRRRQVSAQHVAARQKDRVRFLNMCATTDAVPFLEPAMFFWSEKAQRRVREWFGGPLVPHVPRAVVGPPEAKFEWKNLISGHSRTTYDDLAQASSRVLQLAYHPGLYVCTTCLLGNHSNSELLVHKKQCVKQNVNTVEE